MRMDKKKKGDRLNYILVDKIGHALQIEMTFKKLEKLLNAELWLLLFDLQVCKELFSLHDQKVWCNEPVQRLYLLVAKQF